MTRPEPCPQLIYEPWCVWPNCSCPGGNSDPARDRMTHPAVEKARQFGKVLSSREGSKAMRAAVSRELAPLRNALLDRDTREPIGKDCGACGVKFIGNEWHVLCGRCFEVARVRGLMPHQYREGTTADMGDCAICGYPQNDPIHPVLKDRAGQPDAETIERVGKAMAKKAGGEKWSDPGVAQFWATMARAAIEEIQGAPKE